MSTNYDAIAAEYKRAKQQPWRLYVESYTLLGLAGDLAGKAVLDLACGEGFYTRLLRRNGASRVVGIDASEGMIELARQEEAARPLGVEYRVQDARHLDLAERFDLVVAGYLLNYAPTREALLVMCQGVARCLKPGGRFVTVNNNPAQPPEDFGRSAKYGFVKGLAGELAEGAPVTYRFFLDGRALEITNYHLDVPSHEWALHRAGFGTVGWHPPQVSPAGERAYGKGYWNDFLEHPPVIFVDCRK
jgi:SAM-dependent methyltransferase